VSLVVWIVLVWVGISLSVGVLMHLTHRAPSRER
jgi:hypothetical protein